MTVTLPPDVIARANFASAANAFFEPHGIESHVIADEESEADLGGLLDRLFSDGECVGVTSDIPAFSAESAAAHRFARDGRVVDFVPLCPPILGHVDASETSFRLRHVFNAAAPPEPSLSLRCVGAVAPKSSTRRKVVTEFLSAFRDPIFGTNGAVSRMTSALVSLLPAKRDEWMRVRYALRKKTLGTFGGVPVLKTECADCAVPFGDLMDRWTGWRAEHLVGPRVVALCFSTKAIPLLRHVVAAKIPTVVVLNRKVAAQLVA